MVIDISTLSAEDLDELIIAAARKRAMMAPAHPMKVPAGPIEALVNPVCKLSLNQDGSLLQIRHVGYGWLSFMIPPSERAQMLAQLLQHALTDCVACQGAEPEKDDRDEGSGDGCSGD